LDILTFVDAAKVKIWLFKSEKLNSSKLQVNSKIKIWLFKSEKLNSSKLQVNSKISKFRKEVYKDLNAPLIFTYTIPFLKWATQN